MGVIRTYLDFVLNYAPYFYYLPGSGTTDPEWGRGPAPAAFGIMFLAEAYEAEEFESEKTMLLNKIVELADYLLSIQCTDDLKLAYGGFQSKDGSDYYYAIDAMRAVPALLKAYDLTGTVGYLDAATLAGGTFLYNMQHKPSILGIHDQYYGGFAQAVTLAEAWLTDMYVIDLYGLIGLKMLYDRTSETKYQSMIDDALAFYRSGFESFYLRYSPPPYGDGSWHRTGIPENLVYDDDFSYALQGLFFYENWSQTVKKVYESINTIGPSAEYPAYNPLVCWSGYVDVVDRKPACEYYDGVTAGILFDIRNSQDTLALEQSASTVLTYPDNFMYWGVKFRDYSPMENKQSTVTVSWLGHLLLNYTPTVSVFARVLRAYGEQVTVFSHRETNGTATFTEGTTALALVIPARANEVLIEPGYASNDYLHIYTLANIVHRDKIAFQGREYEVGPVEEFRFREQLMYRTAVCRRIVD